MADTTTPPSTEPWPVGAGVVAVAYSGGRDSTALLHATARMVAAGGHAPAGTRVLALHVHHGLSLQADDWVAHAQAQCQAWAAQGLPVDLVVTRLTGSPSKGQSVEAWARQARYQALAHMAQDAGADLVLLAHHRRDQAETFLLQALRGAGAAGLSAMPGSRDQHGLHWCRPWLTHPREAIEAYVQAHGLAHVDDDSNSDPRFARNRLRLSVWPVLSQSFAQAEASLAQSAAHAADAQACLDQWVSERLPTLVLPSGESASGGPGALSLLRWQALAEAPQRLLLKAWVQQQTGQTLSRAWVMRLQRDWRAQSAQGVGRWPLPGQGELVLYRGALTWHGGVAMDLDQVGGTDAQPPTSLRCAIHQPGRHWLPDGWGVVDVMPAGAMGEGLGGIPLSLLAQSTWRRRQGGEQFQAGPQRPPRCLKKQFQSLGVPAWARHGPLLWWADQLLFVPGLGLDARALALPGGPRVSLAWHAATDGPTA